MRSRRGSRAPQRNPSVATETLIWRLRLTDQTSASAKRVAASLKAVEAEQRRVQRADDARARQAEATARRVAAAAQREQAARARQIARADAQRIRDENRRVAFERRSAASSARNAAAQQRREQLAAQRVARLNAGAFRRDERDRVRASRLSERLAQREQRLMQRNARSMDEGFRSGLSLLGGIGLAAATAVAGITVAFGGLVARIAESVVQIAAFRESSLTALRVVLGSSEAAGRTFRNAMTIANQTPLDTADVVRQQQALAVAGFSEREITPLLAASADLGSAFGTNASQGFSFAIGQIRAAGRLQGQELLQLQNANVSRQAILESIARQLNLGTGQRGIDAAAQAIRQRRVSDNVGIQAALDAVRTRLAGGGQLGAFAQAQSRTIGGAISNLRNAGFNLIASIDFERIPAVQKLKDLVVDLTGALSASSGAGRRAQQLLGAGLNATVNTIRAVVSFGRAALPVVLPIARAFGGGFLAGLRTGFTPLLAVLRALAGGGGPSARTLQALTFLARGLGTAFGLAAAALTTLLLGISTIGTVTSAAFAALVGVAGNIIPQVIGLFARIGTAISEGIAQGIRAAAAAPVQALRGVIAVLPGAAALQLAIRSPSRVFRDQIGAQIPAGLALGIQQGAPAARLAVDQLVAPPAVESGSLRRGGGSSPIVVNVTVQGGRDAQGTGEAVGDAVRRALQGIFVDLAEAGA